MSKRKTKTTKAIAVCIIILSMSLIILNRGISQGFSQDIIIYDSISQGDGQ